MAALFPRDRQQSSRDAETLQPCCREEWVVDTLHYARIWGWFAWLIIPAGLVLVAILWLARCLRRRRGALSARQRQHVARALRAIEAWSGADFAHVERRITNTPSRKICIDPPLQFRSRVARS
jgi:hypothetical protein